MNLRKLAPVFFSLLATAVWVTIASSGNTSDDLTYLPIIVDGRPTVTPTATSTNTPQPTNTAKPTATSTQTPTATATLPPQATGDVRVTKIFYDGVKGRTEPDEYVEILNDSGTAVLMKGWTLSDSSGSTKTFTFPQFTMQPGQTCRVYTNEIHPESCGFSFGNNQAIWNNTGDCAILKAANGSIVDEYCYSGN